jgi:LysR family transcriptional regulator, pca operon transcriptional activator
MFDEYDSQMVMAQSSPPATFLEHRLKLRQLKAVLAIAEHLNLSKAARALGISQPALTKCLHQVETALGVDIFDRTPRGVLPNTFGVAVLERAQRILAEVDRISDDVGRIKAGDAGIVSVGALPLAAAGLLPVAVARLRKAHPGLDFRITQGTTDQLLAKLSAGEIDVMVGRLYETVARDDFHQEILYKEPLSVMVRAGHALSKRQPITGDDLARHDVVLPSLHQKVGAEIERVLLNAGIALPTALRSSDFFFIREIVLSSDLVTILPRGILAGDLSRGLVRSLATTFPSHVLPVGLVSPRGRPRLPGLAALIRALRSYTREMRDSGLID